MPSVSNPFFAEFVEYIETELHVYGYKTTLCNTVKAGNAELEYLDMMNRHIVDGVITGVHSLDVEEYKKIHKPIIALDRYLGEDIPVVAINHKRGGRLAAEELIASGCKKVLYFRGALEVESPYHDRYYEFERIMKKNHINTHSYELEWNRFDVEYYHQVIEDVFSSRIDFDGVFGVGYLAVECMNELIRRGRNVPEDVKIVAYDGTFVTNLAQPRITVIEQPMEQLAKQSAKLIAKLIGGKKYKNKKVLLDVQLRKEESTGNNEQK